MVSEYKVVTIIFTDGTKSSPIKNLRDEHIKNLRECACVKEVKVRWTTTK